MTGLARSLTTASADDRSGTDFYPTPPDVTHALVNWLEAEGIISNRVRIWEPACGEGHMARVLRDRGYPTVASDLHVLGFAGFQLYDFLKHSPSDFPGPEGENRRIGWIITNPPFSQAEAFIRHALTLNVPFAFLLKGQFWHAQRRRALFEQHRPAAVLPLSWRPDFHFGRKGGSPTMECQWTVWGVTPAQVTHYQILARPEVEG